jgi:hypothetical protein
MPNLWYILSYLSVNLKFMNNNKSMWIWTVVVVVVLGLIIWGVSRRGDEVQEAVNNNDVVATSTASSTDNNNGTQTGVTGSGSTLSFTQAVKLYASSRIQFTSPQPVNSCQAFPGKVTYKNGTNVMLDNRTAKTLSLRFDNNTHVLPAYSFKVVKVSSATLPHTYTVDCNTNQNVATIEVQK